MANRLAQSSSAYLKSAAHQPIDWYEFGEEAFNKAKELDRPVLLDIGAVWCHWCHVIDRESYDDPEIADLINQYYVAIKVDRDQRPDIDTRYQHVVASMTGQGGWPLTGFLTYDGRVIYGGTYFPSQAMKNLLVKIKDIYQEKKAEIFAQGPLLTEDMAKAVTPVSQDQTQTSLSKQFYETLLHAAQKQWDPEYGGFGNQPKFPHFSGLQLLIMQAYHHNHPEQRQIITKTLMEMGKGGISDRLVGGLHRYSVDRYWHVPHFEKMAYDNAEGLAVYAQAYRLTGEPFFKEVAEGIIDWVNATLSNQVQGGFYASQDADIDLTDDGDYFTWTIDEVKAALTESEARLVTAYYELTPAGDTHERPGRNVLRTPQLLHELANSLSLPLDEVTQILKLAQNKLQQVRLSRPTPFVDDTLYVNWNGMMICGYLEAADLLALPQAKAFALKTLDRILKDFYQPGQQVFHGEGITGFLEDYAWLAKATLMAYQSTGQATYLTMAQDITALLQRKFEDQANGGFWDTAQDQTDVLGLLKFPRKPVEDNPSSSANAIAISVFNTLYWMTEEENYRVTAERALKWFCPQYENYSLFVAALGIALHQFLNPPLKINVLGQDEALIQAAQSVFYPGKVLTYAPQEGDKPEARLCFGTRCLAPVFEAKAIENCLQTALATV